MEIQPLKEEGKVLRGLLGMLMKKRTDGDLLEISKKNCNKFLTEYEVGVVQDDISGVYVIHVHRINHNE